MGQKQIGEADAAASGGGADVEDLAEHLLLQVLVNNAVNDGEALDGCGDELSTHALGDVGDLVADLLGMADKSVEGGKRFRGGVSVVDEVVDIRLSHADIRSKAALCIAAQNKFDLRQHLLVEELLSGEHQLGLFCLLGCLLLAAGDQRDSL